MAKLLSTKSLPFPLLPWRLKNLEQVFAGNGCIMAIDRQGNTLQKVDNPEFIEPMDAWGNMQEISISQHFPALAVGLKKDHTCVPAKKALRYACEIGGVSYSNVLGTIQSWRHIVQVAVSDAVFALDKWGMVHYAPLSRNDDYASVKDWRAICRIVAGNQNSLFGIRKNGTLLCAGSNCTQGPNGDLNLLLAGREDALDICAIGAECNQVLIACKDSSVVDVRSGEVLSTAHAGVPVFCSNYCLAATMGKDGKVDFVVYYYPEEEALEKFRKAPIASIAVGHQNNIPFVLAIEK